MASVLQLKAFGALPSSRRLSAAQPARSDRIQGSSSVFLVRRKTSRGLSSRRGRRVSIGRSWGGGVADLVVITRSNPDDTTSSVAVEDNVEDVVEDVVEDDVEDDVEDVSAEQQLSPEEEEDRQNIKDILRVVELLRTKRDMTFNEVRLTIMIEDPRDVERRRLLNIEDDRGCSREELGNALAEVNEGRMPEDRITLRELAKEMLNWPNLEDEINPQERLPPVASPYAKVTDTGVDPRLAAERAKVDWDSAADILPGEEKKDISEVLPPAVGFSFLYLISSLPVIIGIAVVLILFFNSLQ